MKCVIVLCLLALCGAAKQATIHAHKDSPVEQVVGLLTDLKGQLEQDSKSEKAVYDKTACWCDQGTHRKAEAIETAQDTLRSVGQNILKYKGQVETLTSEMGDVSANIKDSQHAQQEATAIRQRENSEYLQEAAETKQAMAALDGAIQMLKAGTSLLQAENAKSAFRKVLQALPAKANLKDKSVVLLNEVVSGKIRYAPQSQTIQGILTDMYSTFASDLEASTNDEATRSSNFESFLSTKEAELESFKKLMSRKSEQKAEAEGLLAETTQDYDDTDSQLKSDVKFFDETKKYCTDKHEEWTTRENLRTQELSGIDKAIDILGSDEARSTFHKAIKPGKEVRTGDYDSGIDIDSFIEMSNQHGSAASAYSILKEQAARSHNIRLAEIAASVRAAKYGHFDQVIKSINSMMETLKDEAAADTQKRDQCKEEYHQIESTTKELSWKISKNNAKIDKLESKISDRTDEKVQTVTELKNVGDEIKTMEQQRVADNQAFAEAKTLDTKSVTLLMQARDSLKEYYSNNGIDMGPIQGSVKDVSLAQHKRQEPEFEVSEDARPAAEFSDKASRVNQAKGIVSVLTMLIEDLNDEIKNGMKAEEQAQTDFDNQLTSAKNVQQELQSKKTHLEEAIASRDEEKTQETGELAGNQKDIDLEKKYKESIKADCDFIISSFSERAEKRDAEMHSLMKAKEFLASDFVGTGSHDMDLLQKVHKKA